MKIIAILLLFILSAGCATLTETERIQNEYERHDALNLYTERKAVCHLLGGGWHFESTGSSTRSLSLTEMRFAYCSKVRRVQ